MLDPRWANLTEEQQDAIRKYNRETRDGRLVQDAGGIRVERIQSDKIGQDWIRYYVNNVLVRSDYVLQDNPNGTANNPIPFTDGIYLIPNAYYTLDNVRKVWMGAAGATGISWNDEYFVPF